jgi:hypothetical protein
MLWWWKYIALLGGLCWLLTSADHAAPDGHSQLSAVISKASRQSHDRLVNHVRSWVETQDDAVREHFESYLKARTASSLVASIETALDWLLWLYRIIVPIMLLGKLSSGRASGPSPSSSSDLPAAAGARRPARLDVAEEPAAERAGGPVTTTSLPAEEEERRRLRLAVALRTLEVGGGHDEMNSKLSVAGFTPNTPCFSSE